MYSQKAVFTNVQNTWYWSSSPDVGGAWVVSMANGSVNGGFQPGSLWVWPCRESSGSPHTPSSSTASATGIGVDTASQLTDFNDLAQ